MKGKMTLQQLLLHAKRCICQGADTVCYVHIKSEVEGHIWPKDLLTELQGTSHET
jgi:hypothetical protein